MSDTIDHTATHDEPANAQIVERPQSVVVDGITPKAAEELRQHVEEASGGGNRFVWFAFGFIAALVAGVVASIVFLVASDEDDDGTIDLEVPTVDVNVDP